MESYRVRKAPPLQGELEVPGDKSISHRAVMLSALSNGPCEIRNFLAGEDCLATAAIFQQLGITIEEASQGVLVVHGRNGHLNPPGEDLYCGNSGTTMRLMAGILASQPFTARLTGDASLSRRPMKRVIEPLRRMGAALLAETEEIYPPLVVRGGPLHGIEYTLPVASAQVKSAILLAGLRAKGVTAVIEPAPTRDHTERMLRHFQVPVYRENGRVSVSGGVPLESRDVVVPGDISSAAFWLVAAAAIPGSELRILNIGLNPTRTGILRVLTRMGATVRETIVENDPEPRGVVEVQGGPLQAVHIGGQEIPSVIDELPVIAVAAAVAEGTTIISGASELRVKETDRLAALAHNLGAFGVQVVEHPDGLEITGSTRLRGATVESFGDHRIAMAFAIAGLLASGETHIRDTECVATSYPGFAQTLQKVQKGAL